MHFLVESVTPRQIAVRLRDGLVETEVTAWGPTRAAEQLMDCLEAARDTGYGECFWPERTGQYWWMARRDDRRIEVVVLWSTGAVTGWQHVYRATDEVDYVIDLVRSALGAHHLLPS